MSIVAMVFTGVVVAMGVLAGVFLVAFIDYCPPPRCSAENAFVAVATALGAAVLVGLIGMVVTVVRLSRRRTAWPVAVATLAVCSVAVALGGFGYFAAVGAVGA